MYYIINPFIQFIVLLEGDVQVQPQILFYSERNS
jgi:hypothetical protein